MRMPHFLPRKRWEPAPAGFRPAQYGGVFPPVQKHPDGRLIIDQNRMADGSYEVAVFDNADDPALPTLPAHTPRVVKALYRREWRLRFLRATDAGSIVRNIDAAFSAWDQFLAQRPAAH